MLYINGFVSKKLFSNFEFIFEIFRRKPKNIQTNSETCKIFKVQCVSYISMDFTRQALQINGKLIKFRNHFSKKLLNFKIILALGLCKRGGGVICAEQHAF